MMRKFCALLLLGTLCGHAFGQQHSEESLIAYKIQPGDTLNKLSKKYFKQPADFAIIRHLNNLRSVNLLPAGEILKIPRQAVKQSPSLATIIALSCTRMIRAGTPLRPMSIGSVLSEGAIIDIPAECHVAMQLEDGTMLRLPSSAAVKISVLRKNALEATPEVQLDLVRGKVELEVYKGRAKTTPFEIRTPLSVTGVRGTEFRVGYAPAEQTGQVEVLGGVVAAKGMADPETKSVNKGQGMPFDSSGKALPIEKLLNAPAFQNAERLSDTSAAYNIKFSPLPQANYYAVTSGKNANLLGEKSLKTLQTPEVESPPLSQEAFFYQFATVSKADLMGPSQIYGFCIALNEAKSGRCRATFDAPMTENTTITFSLTRHTQVGAQELVSTKKLLSRNGQFTIEGLPSGHYDWAMSYVTTREGATPTVTKQSGAFDLITLTPSTP